MPTYILFDPKTKEMQGPLTTSADQIPWNTDGGRFRVFELETAEGWRTVNIEAGKISETYDLGLLTRPMVAAINAAAEERIAQLLPDPARAGVYALKLAEANGKGDRPLLTAEAKVTGETVAELAKKVIAQAAAADENAAEVGRVEGTRRAAIAAIDAAQTFDQLLSLPEVSFASE